MSARKPPLAPTPALVPGVLVALLLVAVGVVAVRELAVDQGWATGSSWSTAVLDSLDGLRATTGVVVAGVVLVVVGLLVLWRSLAPARRTHLATDTDDLWVSRGAVAALAEGVADRQRGVVTAAAEASRRRVEVTVVAREDAAGVRSRIEEALGDRLGALTRTRIDVDVREVSR